MEQPYPIYDGELAHLLEFNKGTGRSTKTTLGSRGEAMLFLDLEKEGDQAVAKELIRLRDTSAQN